MSYRSGKNRFVASKDESDFDHSSTVYNLKEKDNELSYKNNADKNSKVINDGMSMEELLAVQEEIGTKAFAQEILKKDYGNNGHISKERNSYKNFNSFKNYKQRDDDDDSPLELPLLRRPAPKMNFMATSKNSTIKRPMSRDPRFDDLSGKLDILAWKKNYKFVTDKRSEELQTLKKQLSKTKDLNKKGELKKIVHRMENQKREGMKAMKAKDQKRQEREIAISSLKQGKAPRYASKKEKYLEMKISQFDKLNDEKKVEKYLKRKEKKSRTF